MQVTLRMTLFLHAISRCDSTSALFWQGKMKWCNILKRNPNWKDLARIRLVHMQKGTTLQQSGFAVWGGGQPDGGAKEPCGTMFYNGELNDLSCSHKCFFICEHDIGSLAGAIDERFGQFIR